MLSKSFKPAKCKISLKLAVSRIKLLRNKREIQIKQMRRELAQLIENGQDQTARIRVEHVIREEKTSAAYELIELFCELLAARLPIIDSQKHCPVDLKEAVATVIFASPRCSDITELKDISKQFAAKYGKEFTNAALDIRPDCGVSRLVIEKLSSRAPDIELKMKTLKAIAEEHNVKWDLKSFEDELQKPHEDLLNGPTSFAGSTKYHTEHYNVNPSPAPNPAPTQINVPSTNIPQTHYNVNSPSVPNIPQTHYNVNSPPVPNPTQINASSVNIPQTRYTVNPTSAPDPIQANASSFNIPQTAKLESTISGGEVYSNTENTEFSSTNKSAYTMEFQNATSAAQAAAESAERASIAARAAARFASHENMSRQTSNISRQTSTRSNESPKHDSKYEKPENLRVFLDEHSPKEPAPSVNHDVRSSQGVKTKLQNPLVHEQNRGNPSDYLSSNSSPDFDNDDILDANFHKGHINNVHLESNSFKSKAEDPSPKTIKNNVSIKYDDDVRNSNIFKQSSFGKSPAVVFDDYSYTDEGSSSIWNTDENLLDAHREEDSSNYHSSTSRNDKISPESFAKPSSSQPHLFTESHAEEHSLANVSSTPAFDASDEESSDVDDQIVHRSTSRPSSFSRKSSIKSTSDDKNSIETNKVTKSDSTLYDRNIEADLLKDTKFIFSSSDEEEPRPQRKEKAKFLPTNLGYEDSESSKSSSNETQGIKFGLLTGGLKHKSLPRPPYVKTSASDVSDPPKSYVSQSKSKYSYVDSPEPKNYEHLQISAQDSDYLRSQKSSLAAYSDSDDDIQHSSNTDARKYKQISPVKSSMKADSNYNTSIRANANVRHSRRTRDYISPKVAEPKPEQPEYKGSSKIKQVQTSYDESSKFKQAQTSYEESPKSSSKSTGNNSMSYKESSNLKQVQTSNDESSNSGPKSTGNNSIAYKESSNFKQVQIEESSKSIPKSTSNSSISSDVSNEGSVKKGSRSHPKLPPDYDTFEAHFRALRSNQR